MKWNEMKTTNDDPTYRVRMTRMSSSAVDHLNDEMPRIDTAMNHHEW